MDTYVALLRGINVGGKNKVPMAELRAATEELGYSDVRTYIQSGNVVFRAARDTAEITEAFEAMMPRRFRLDTGTIVVVVLHIDRMGSIVRSRPPGFGDEPDTYKYDVAFLKGASGRELMPYVTLHPQVDAIWAAEDVFYFRRPASRVSHEWTIRTTGAPVSPSVTVRNWNTTTKVLSMMKAVSGD